MTLTQKPCPVCQHLMELVDVNTDVNNVSKLEWQCLCGYREPTTSSYRRDFGEE